MYCKNSMNGIYRFVNCKKQDINYSMVSLRTTFLVFDRASYAFVILCESSIELCVIALPHAKHVIVSKWKTVKLC